MPYLRSAILFIAILSTFIYTKGQKTTFSKWLTVISDFKLYGQISFHFDAQVKINPELKHLQGLLLRPAIIFRVKNNMAAALGYALIENRRAVGTVNGYAPEQDIWEQLQFTNMPGFILLTNRFRLEQRFISNSVLQENAFHTENYVFANRFRYFVKGLFPLNGQRKFEKGYYADLQNEIFINIGDKSNVNGKFFDQNRAAFGFGYRFNRKLDGELGYLNQYISGRNAAFTNNHIIQLTAYIRL